LLRFAEIRADMRFVRSGGEAERLFFAGWNLWSEESIHVIVVTLGPVDLNMIEAGFDVDVTGPSDLFQTGIVQIEEIRLLLFFSGSNRVLIPFFWQ